jgi:ribonuclease Z
MAMMAVTILGNNSALSMHDRHQTAQLVTTDHTQLLVDCGENTQDQLQRFKVKKSKIDHIFISHLHGDHYYGLPGLLNSYSLNNRDRPLHLYANPLLMEIIELQLKAADTRLNYELVFHPITKAGTLLSLERLQVSCFPVSHRIPCWGFVFCQVDKKSSQELKYAYCADTKYEEMILPYIQGANLIYHESTYLADQSEKAVARFHSTSIEAAAIAKQANAGRLLLGHFSSKYADLSAFEKEASQVFQHTEISREGVSYLV